MAAANLANSDHMAEEERAGLTDFRRPASLQAATAGRRLGRVRGPDRRRQQPSNRWHRTAAALGKAQGRVADQRRDALHKATTGLTGRFGTLVIEDLAVRNLTRKHSTVTALTGQGRSVAATGPQARSLGSWSSARSCATT